MKYQGRNRDSRKAGKSPEGLGGVLGLHHRFRYGDRFKKNIRDKSYDEASDLQQTMRRHWDEPGARMARRESHPDYKQDFKRWLQEKHERYEVPGRRDRTGQGTKIQHVEHLHFEDDMRTMQFADAQKARIDSAERKAMRRLIKSAPLPPQVKQALLQHSRGVQFSDDGREIPSVPLKWTTDAAVAVQFAHPLGIVPTDPDYPPANSLTELYDNVRKHLRAGPINRRLARNNAMPDISPEEAEEVRRQLAAIGGGEDPEGELPVNLEPTRPASAYHTPPQRSEYNEMLRRYAINDSLRRANLR